MIYYINSTASFSPESDIKSLIPDANLRRRMSRIVKMGVGTGLECLRKSGLEADAIVTATGLGCLADSEKFLRSVIENEEQLLNPTPFIQSTFNTIGGHIALITGNKGYNMTYSHREYTFECALLDALLLLEEGAAGNVLAGAADERTPLRDDLLERMGVSRHGKIPEEGAYFFLFGRQPGPDCRAVLSEFSFGGSKRPAEQATVQSAEQAPEPPQEGIPVFRPEGPLDFGSARCLFRAVKEIEAGLPAAAVENGMYHLKVSSWNR